MRCTGNIGKSDDFTPASNEPADVCGGVFDLAKIIDCGMIDAAKNKRGCGSRQLYSSQPKVGFKRGALANARLAWHFSRRYKKGQVYGKTGISLRGGGDIIQDHG